MFTRLIQLKKDVPFLQSSVLFLYKQSITDDNNFVMHEDLNFKSYNLYALRPSTSKLKKVFFSFDLYDTRHSKQPYLNGITWFNSENIPSS